MPMNLKNNSLESLWILEENACSPKIVLRNMTHWWGAFFETYLFVDLCECFNLHFVLFCVFVFKLYLIRNVNISHRISIYLIRKVTTLISMSQLYSFHFTTAQFSMSQFYVVSMSQLYNFHFTTVWFPCHNYMVSMSQLSSFHFTTAWFSMSQLYIYMFSMSQPSSFHLTTVWFPCHSRTVSIWQLYGFHVTTVQFPSHNCMVSMSQLYSFHVTTVQFPCHNWILWSCSGRTDIIADWLA